MVAERNSKVKLTEIRVFTSHSCLRCVIRPVCRVDSVRPQRGETMIRRARTTPNDPSAIQEFGEEPSAGVSNRSFTA
jgi:hypothetical protein